MAHPLFGPEIKEMLDGGDAVGLAALCEELHPATIAEAVEDDFTPDQIWEIISRSEIRTQAAIFEYLPIGVQEQMVEDTKRPQVGRLIGKMSHDDRVGLMRRLPTRVSENLLRLVDDADRRDIRKLFEYGANTVGAIMTTDYAWLPPTLTAAEAVDQLRQQAPDRETIYYIYILEEAKRRPDGSLAPRPLLGIISLRDLILAPRHAVLRELMETEVVSLLYTDGREIAADLLAQYDFIAVPVLDETGGLVGIVTHDDALDVVTQEATEDIQRQGGVTPLNESYLEAGFFKIWRSRAQWLALLFVASFGTYTVISIFEDVLAEVVVLSLFIPLCISTGGNSGTQASTLITRAMALGDVQLSDWKRLLRRELFLGLALGLFLGVVAFARGAATPADTRGGPHKLAQPLVVTFKEATDLTADEFGDYTLPAGSEQTLIADKLRRIRLPANESVQVDATGKRFTFPTESEVRTDPVSRWRLGLVIALAVLGICLWGTMVGATLPLVFKKFGGDPAVASGPFVATAVDITGIAIFFLCAKFLLV